MQLDTLKRRIGELYGKKSQAPSIIVEPDTSLTFEYGDHQTWNLPNSFMSLRPYQQDVHDALFKHNVKRFYLAWSRRLGKEVTSWMMLVKYVFLHRCTAVAIYPDAKQGTRILWEGNMSVGETTQDYLGFLPPFIDRDKDINHTVKRIDIPNGSTIWLLGSENYDKLRGINPKIALFSEYAFQDPEAYNVLRPIFVENNGIIIVQTTFDGKNHGYRLWENIKNDPEWYASFMTAKTAIDSQGERYISEAFIDGQRREGVSEHKINQEYYMEITGSEDKYYFTTTLLHLKANGHFKTNLAMCGYPLYTFWDIGVEDSNTVIYVQIQGNTPCIVGYHESVGKTYEWEIDQITKWRTSRNISLGKHFLPHDGKNRSKLIAGEEAKNAQWYISQKLGEPCDTVKKPSSETIGLQLTRAILPRCHIDKDACSRLIECLEQHAKDWDDDNQVWKQTTKHDWTSHAVKAVQTFALAIEENKLILQKQGPISYVDNSQFPTATTGVFTYNGGV